MGKKKKLAQTYGGIGEGNPVRIMTDHIGKRGNIKGGKNEKKALKDICPHHIYTKKGRLKATIQADGKGHCRCYMCKDIIPMAFASDSELDKVSNNFGKYVSQAKLMAVSIGAGKKAIRQVTDTSILVKRFPKLYKNLRGVAEKQDRAKKVKKKQRSKNISNEYGGWGSY